MPVRFCNIRSIAPPRSNDAASMVTARKAAAIGAVCCCKSGHRGQLRYGADAKCRDSSIAHRGNADVRDPITRRINHRETREGATRRFRHRSCSLTMPRNHVPRKPIDSDVTAKETHTMNPVALLTPTYGHDLELCTLLCESVDRHVTSYAKHYLLVPDCDLPLFAHLASERRIVLPASAFLPDWLRPLPRIIQRKRRQFWWSLRAKPVSGWHVQQLLKIAATIALPYQRYCILDSDVVFFRDFDLSRYEYPHPIPLLNMVNEVTADQPRHSRWVETSHQLLGLPTPPLPASDFIGHIIFWDKQTTRALTSRVEAISKLDWIEALCRTREFSEYMLYGFFVQNDAASAARHT
jgi:hypothetical protein